MRFFTVLGIIFYALVLTIVGLGMIGFSVIYSLDTNPIQPQDINNLLAYFQNSASSRITVLLSGILLILISISFAQIILGRLQRERTIAFKTASGEVTVSLSAVEDLIKRLTGIMPEIKELRPHVIATKKGIVVDLRVVLRSEANIPELTARLQEITRSKIQEVLGIEEQIIIGIHIVKIISLEDKKRKDGQSYEPPHIPFGGYTRA
ncbi:MAG: alkaline shock response membrane anchor protein AmaP [Candidatus Omnitrophica bacterium]|nr:alkaline shock response membrane anchor protein AmaP [Candidatus Omnitrophota bacterium]